MITKIKLRNDTSQNWQNNNPILSAGEAGYDSESKVLKIGDGVKPWNDLDFFGIKKQRLILEENLMVQNALMYEYGNEPADFQFYENAIPYSNRFAPIQAIIKMQAKESFNFMGLAIEAGSEFYWSDTNLSFYNHAWVCERNYSTDEDGLIYRQYEVYLNEALGWQVANDTAENAEKWRLIMDVTLA